MPGRIIAMLMLAAMLSLPQASALPPPPSDQLPRVESLAPVEGESGPDVIWSEMLIWGTIRYTWRIDRGGEGVIRRVGEPDIRFAVSAEQFDRIHDMANYRRLTSRGSGRCEPGPTDGPYGGIHWRDAGELRQVTWTTAYYCTNSGFINERISEADAAVWALSRQ
ncbi:hypothetical protein [Terricaulis sp.]|uniref:hypothetical protein n=1 Tax=Terricaulis sp. TaxID=2768686 RepID=UPI0037850776